MSKAKALDVARRIGFMQGRLSPMIDGRIQAFPWDHWREELAIGAECGFSLLEWTLDQDGLYENPLMTAEGQGEIRALCETYGFTIPSLTGDCFMQVPFWKAEGDEAEDLKRDFLAVAEACAAVGISMMVVPLVDNGRLENAEQENALVSFLTEHEPTLKALGVKVGFESDFTQQELARFIERLGSQTFGVNYDIGNSAALGFNPAEEIAAYGARILNVHIKDRVLGGTTVPLGTGAADFAAVYEALGKCGYVGNYILQTARATDDDHAGALVAFRDMSAAEIARNRA